MVLTKLILQFPLFQFIGRKYCKFFQPRVVLDEELKRIPDFRENYHSQLGQDWFVYNIVFKGEKKDGFMLDIGANDPEVISNSLFFEEQGWDGIAFEPIPDVHAKWKGRRKMECLNNAVGDTNKTVKFTLAGYSSGVSDVVDVESKNEIEVQQVVIGDILKERNITHVDFVSLDVEGYEFNVLNGIDLNAVDITCFSIENNKNNGLPDEKLRSYMKSRGYILFARISIDDIFIKEDYEI